MKTRKRLEVIQVLKFGFVGLVASLVHALAFHVFFVEVSFSHLAANLLGFFLAFFVSYVGQFRWTFKRESQQVSSQVKAFFRFIRVALLGLALNLLWAQLVISWLQLSHFIYLFMLLIITPLIVFTLTKFWVMKG